MGNYLAHAIRWIVYFLPAALRDGETGAPAVPNAGNRRTLAMGSSFQCQMGMLKAQSRAAGVSDAAFLQPSHPTN